MCSSQLPASSAFAVLLISTLCGCAGLDEYRRCGYQGCGDDAKITADLQARLEQYRDLAAPDHIYVQTVGGVVYLTGNVLTSMQRDTAEAAARETPGVNRLVDTLFVDADSGR